ncbi:MAG: class I SAM-dependent methyltransferase [Sporichthyaceae bacterium]
MCTSAPVPPTAVADYEAMFDAARPYYQGEIAAGIERFWDPRREDCPWCGSRDLKVMFAARDTTQGKPGRFTLNRCRRCQHVFQNPMLNPTGLNFYYKDFYDGIGRAAMEAVFDPRTDVYHSRARMLEPFFGPGESPKNWLDIGAGYGHFCRDAAAIFPGATFDGLDQGQGVLDAVAKGWISHAHHSWFPNLEQELTGRYDVISMFHYLEHVLDIRTELDLTHRVMPDGGYLLIEVPNPSSILRVLGRWWIQWFQPQHLHMPPLGNLMAALTARNLRPVAVQVAEAHIPVDMICAAGAPFMAYAPHPGVPWATKARTRWREKKHELVWTKLSPPFLKAAYRADEWLDPIIRRTGQGNLYRILARKEGPNPLAR